LTTTLPSGAVSVKTPSTGFSATTMTRSGAPVQGACGAGKMVISAEFAHLSEAAMAGICAIESERKHPPAVSNDTRNVAAKRVEVSISIYNLAKDFRNRHSIRQAGTQDIQSERISQRN
jgi:hypothetical protein